MATEDKNHIEQPITHSTSYGKSLWKKLRQKRANRWAIRLLYVLIFVSVFGDFLANDRPIVCTIDQELYFPVLRQYGEQLGWIDKEARFEIKPWREQNFGFKLWPLIPYAASNQNINKKPNISPLDNKRQPASLKWRHWLGTDKLNRDVAAGMISGTRTAMLVGIVSMGVAAFIGILLGGLAGYFGDNRLWFRRSELMGGSVGLVVALFIAFGSRAHAFHVGHIGWQLLISLFLIISITLALAYLSRFLFKGKWGRKRAYFPTDMLVMRLIEMINSVPALLLLLAILAILRQNSLLMVMLIIGLLRWTSIARFIRGELLKVRSMAFIDAARTIGLKERRIALRHALPNSIRPALIALAFGMASSVLLEAYLSFLSIGLPENVVTWGSLLRQASQKVTAWWLAIFPGMAIFVTVIVFNYLGEALTEITGE